MIDIFIFAVLLFLSGFFSGSETAFTSITEYQLASMKLSKTKKKLLNKLIKDKQTVISTLLVGNNIINTVLAVYAGVVANRMSASLPEGSGPLIASFVSIVLLLIFGEVLPKQFGVAFTKGWCTMSAYIIYFLMLILMPITKAMNWLSKKVMKLLPLNANDDAPTVSELMLMAENSEKAGNIDSMEKNLMFTSSQINDLTAEDVMIPKNKIIAATATVKPTELIQTFKTHLYSRIPIYKNSIDDIIGIFNIKECLRLDPNKFDTFDISKHLKKPIYIPGNVTIGNLMEQMKASRNHMAVVVSEYGVTEGIVTLENILERIIGLIGDEYDDEDDSKELVKQSNEITELEIEGLTSLADISKIINIDFSNEIHHKVNTINGFLIDLKGDFLTESETFNYKDFEFKVLSIKGKCANMVKITKKK